MKTLFYKLSVLSLFLNVLNVSAYTLSIVNNSKLPIYIKGAGKVVCTVPGNGTITTCNLDVYAFYQVTCPRQSGEQSLFFIERSYYQVIRAFPELPKADLTKFTVKVNADNKYIGSFDTFRSSDGSMIQSGSCFADDGEITCKLSGFDEAKVINLILN